SDFNITKFFAEIATFTTGQRGCTVLMCGNQKFVKNRKSSTRTYWICSKKDVTWCRARVVTARDKHGTERILHRSFEHNHTRKYPRYETGVRRTEHLIKKLMSK
ncbi:uncharacterized protein LOC118738157, partial [Rhagoletis pomonella]|uniref:uncharacterized protein LOC118738157 n=1 Tax=Rhagoletis pomonella TaxID=28610 RepID=UPI001783E13C